MSLFGDFTHFVKARNFLSDTTAYFSAANALADSPKNILGLSNLEKKRVRGDLLLSTTP